MAEIIHDRGDEFGFDGDFKVGNVDAGFVRGDAGDEVGEVDECSSCHILRELKS